MCPNAHTLLIAHGNKIRGKLRPIRDGFPAVPLYLKAFSALPSMRLTHAHESGYRAVRLPRTGSRMHFPFPKPCRSQPNCGPLCDLSRKSTLFAPCLLLYQMYLINRICKMGGFVNCLITNILYSSVLPPKISS